MNAQTPEPPEIMEHGLFPDIQWRVCPECGRRLPSEYASVKRAAHLMRLCAWYNFRRHFQACWRRSHNAVSA